MKKRFVMRIILVFLLTALCLTSCNDIESDEKGSTSELLLESEEVTESEAKETTDAALPTLKIAENTNILFSLVCPENADAEFLNLFMKLAEEIDARTGGSVAYTTDFRLPGEDTNAESFEIFFGNCDHPAVDEVKNSLGIDDYAVRRVGNKIVLFGHTRETLLAAMTCFLENSIRAEQNANGETLLVYVEDYTYRSGRPQLFSEENPITLYQIVYPEGDSLAYDLAKRFAKRLGWRLDITIPVVSDAATESDCEIVIGNTGRTPSEKTFSGVKEHEFCVLVLEKKLFVFGGSMFSLEHGMEKMIRADLATSPYTDMFNFYADFCEISPVYCEGSTAARYADTDLRIMSWNILNESLGEKIPVEIRDEKAAAAIMHYAPDVIGMQELTDAWYHTLESMIGEDYAFVPTQKVNGTNSYISILYHTKTVRLITYGAMKYSVEASLTRPYVWGLFERISDGKRFIVSSTHWDVCTHPERIAIEATEMAEFISELYHTYQVPMFCTGDYNATEENVSFLGLLSDTGFRDSRMNAKKVGNSGRTDHRPSLGDQPETGGAIDHVVVSDEVTVRYYTRLVDQPILDASDHCPIYIDVKLGE